MSTISFEDRMAQISDQIRQSDPSIADEIRNSVQSARATWERGHFRASVTLHSAESPPRLSLQLSTGEYEHPAPLQIEFYEADVVNMIAVPIAALLAGHGEGGA
jgi:hypothetical protein